MLDAEAGQVLQIAERQFISGQCDDFYRILHRAVSIEWTPAVMNKLAVVFERAFEFYRIVLSQESQLQITLLQAMRNGQSEAFYPEDMEVLNGGMDDEGALFGRPIVVSVFPAVYKKASSSNTSVSISPFMLESMTVADILYCRTSR